MLKEEKKVFNETKDIIWNPYNGFIKFHKLTNNNNKPSKIIFNL